ncbi:MAG: hypothetical protein KKG78_06035 [Alphaproteobacteria bacterium]|nr:hypothetical protein [Alphaproteobacteria bacterium]
MAIPDIRLVKSHLGAVGSEKHPLSRDHPERPEHRVLAMRAAEDIHNIRPMGNSVGIVANVVSYEWPRMLAVVEVSSPLAPETKRQMTIHIEQARNSRLNPKPGDCIVLYMRDDPRPEDYGLPERFFDVFLRFTWTENVDYIMTGGPYAAVWEIAATQR